jgi:hypothetical protein
MTKPRLVFCTSLLAGLLAATGARQALAQDPVVPVDPANPTPAEQLAMGGPELTPLALPTGQWDIRVPIVIGMDKDFGGKPISLPVDVYYGLTDQLTLGVTHSFGVVQPVMRYDTGMGICLSSETSGCPKVYNNIGFDAIFQFMPGVIQLAAHAGLDIWSISDPFLTTLRLGLLAQAPLGTNIAIMADPRLFVGLNERDMYNNKDFLWLPLAVQFWVNEMVRISGRTTFGGPLDGFGDAYFGSLGVFGAFRITDMIEAFASFDFTNLYGKKGPNVGAADGRTLVLGVNFRL